MGKEVERKYLVKDDRWRREAGPGVRYLQGYLSLDEERSVRVRLDGGSATITVKGKAEGSARDEFEYPIPIEDAREMVARLSIKPIIEKTRYEIRVGDLKWQIDEYAGENRGLVIAEAETEKAARDISKPDWVGEEVTGDPRYSNLNLVKQPYSRWKQRAGN